MPWKNRTQNANTRCLRLFPPIRTWTSLTGCPVYLLKTAPAYHQRLRLRRRKFKRSRPFLSLSSNNCSLWILVFHTTYFGAPTTRRTKSSRLKFIPSWFRSLTAEYGSAPGGRLKPITGKACQHAARKFEPIQAKIKRRHKVRHLNTSLMMAQMNRSR